MRVTDPAGQDWQVQRGTTVATIRAAWGCARLYCGITLLTDDHPAGVTPLLDGAALTTTRGPVTAPPVGPHLAVVRGPDAGGVHPAGEPVTIGSHPAADLCIDDPTVSRRHARLQPGPPPRLLDLGSTNGIGTRWRRVRPWPAGTPVTLGHTWIELRGTPAETSDTPSQGSGFPWPAIVGSLISGIIIAVITGRWYLALIGLAFPLSLLVTRWVRKARASHAAPETPPLPSGAVAIRGEKALVRAYARALMIDRAARLPDWDEDWVRWLPAQDNERVILLGPGAEAPSWCTTTVDVWATRTRESSPDGTAERPALAMSTVTAEAAARRIAGMQSGQTLPESMRWSQLTPLDHRHVPGKPRTLTIALGTALDGDMVLDLDAHGPHILVAGTTGSGKSVLLETVVAGLAYALSPDDLVIAIMDFKGGAGLGSCMTLPHIAATVTDLDEAQAQRALKGLAREVADRKRLLAHHGYASLSDWERHGDAPPRLLVVIDEYQEISLRMRDFLPDLARIAAQGRSLGLHLILATQRPSGAVTPEVRANIGSAIALRVNSEAESRDILGTPQAAELPRSAAGRALISGPDGLTEFQTALPAAGETPPLRRVGEPDDPGVALAQLARERWQDSARATPLWCPPLPRQLDPTPRASGYHCGLRDVPHERRQEDIVWHPHDGSLMVIGPARSGKTSILRALATQATGHGHTAVWLPEEARLAARTITVAAARPDVLLLVDGVDTALARLAKVDDGAAQEALTDRLALGLPTAMSGAPSTPMRISTHTAVIAVTTGTDRQHASTWGVPREDTSDLEASSHPARAWVKDGSGHGPAQLVTAATTPHTALVAALPASPPEDVWAVGGDDCHEVPCPATATVVGPDGPMRRAIVASIGDGAQTADIATMVTTRDTIILSAPRARDVRTLARAAGGGLVDPVPVPGRAVVIQHDHACAIQLGLPVVGHLLDGISGDSRSGDHSQSDR